MAHLSLRPLSLADAPMLLVLMRRAEGGLGRLPDEMDLPWMEEALAGALNGGIAIGAWDGSRLVGMIKASRMPSVQFQHVLWDLTIAVDPESQGRGIGQSLFEALFASAATLTPKNRAHRACGQGGPDARNPALRTSRLPPGRPFRTALPSFRRDL